ncbi:hypothetical protein F2P81_016758 [Scophthalmus maximus]|uniref:Uncharacterized protein n=1 Tax=Scophthalmus maximus TaxID=52904 RepID=A0A6A4SA21_SCOMX|nr:hypothetical protein F2P81_016758 [Scophthalmus maximus]
MINLRSCKCVIISRRHQRITSHILTSKGLECCISVSRVGYVTCLSERHNATATDVTLTWFALVISE